MLPHKSGREPVRGLSVRTAAAPAERESGRHIGEFLLDLGQLESEVALVSPGLGGVPLGQNGERTSLAKVPQSSRRRQGDRLATLGSMPNRRLRSKLASSDLGIEGHNGELDVRQPGRRCGRVAKVAPAPRRRSVSPPGDACPPPGALPLPLNTVVGFRSSTTCCAVTPAATK